MSGSEVARRYFEAIAAHDLDAALASDALYTLDGDVAAEFEDAATA